MLLPLLKVLHTDNPRHKAKNIRQTITAQSTKTLANHMKLHNNPLVSASFMLFELQWSSSRHRSANVDSLSTSDPKWMVIHRTWVAVGVLHPEQFCEPPGICRGPTLTCRAIFDCRRVKQQPWPVRFGHHIRVLCLSHGLHHFLDQNFLTCHATSLSEMSEP